MSGWKEEKKEEKVFIRVAVDSGSDLPEEWTKRYNIRVINNHIITETGTFDDTEEVDTDVLFRYMDNGARTMQSEPPSVDEFRTFFMSLLRDAEHVMFITLAKNVSKSYERAKEAASDLERVHIVNSGHLSSAAGMLALYAAHLAETEHDPDVFLEKTETFRTRIRCSMLLDSTEYMMRNGRISATAHRLMDAFMIHPVITAKDSKISVKGIVTGDLDRSRSRYIRGELKQNKQIDPSLVFVVYAGVEPRELEQICALIEERIKTLRLVCHKLSPALAGNAGPGTFGIIFCVKDSAEQADAFSFIPEAAQQEIIV